MNPGKTTTTEQGVFHRIAPLYGLFYCYQKKYYNAVLDGVQDHLDLSIYKRIIDVGCGTGALCSVLHQRGFIVTGADSAVGMLDIAAKKQENKAVRFLQADVLKGLPFEDKSFDVSTASFVAHGLKEEERKTMYKEMSRITKHIIIIHDYNKNRSFIVDIVEGLEGGDYFNFIKHAKAEMEESFTDVATIDINKRAVWYVCRPRV